MTRKPEDETDVTKLPTALNLDEGDGSFESTERSENSDQQTACSEAPQLLSTQMTEAERDDAAAELGERIRQRIDAAEAQRAAAPDPMIGMELGGKFHVTEKLGEGGMGAVYKARQRGMERDVAIKALLKQMTDNEAVVKRFLREAKAISRLEHPHTIRIYDIGETSDGRFYIAMEFLDGASLQQVLHTEGALAPKRALKIARQIATSLREAHSKGIVHRDLKPDNIFLVTRGDDSDFVKVLDFGVAKLREQDNSNATLTKAGAIFGTPRYMSPEQSTSATHVDHRSDLYSIGVLLYEMLAGRAPFEADTPLSLLIKHVQEAPPRLAAVRPDLVIPARVEDVTRRLLAKKPDDRPQTAEALVRLIEQVDAELDDVYQRVVTCEYAESLGLDTERAVETQLNTLLHQDTAHNADALAGLGDKTIFNEEVPQPSRWRRPLIGALLFLLVLGGGIGGVYASLESLPAELEFSARLDNLGVGEVPERVLVGISSTPANVAIRVGEVEYKTPVALKRLKGHAPLSYKVVDPKFQPTEGVVGFTEDADIVIPLVAIGQRPHDTVEESSEDAVNAASDKGDAHGNSGLVDAGPSPDTRSVRAKGIARKTGRSKTNKGKKEVRKPKSPKKPKTTTFGGKVGGTKAFE